MNLAAIKAAMQDGGDLNELLGGWVNANQASQGIQHLNISCDHHGAFWLEAQSYCGEEAIDQGKIAMDVHQGGRQQSGFHASCEDSHSTIELVANYKLGVLVIESFHGYRDGRNNSISREFFRRDGVHTPVAAVSQSMATPQQQVDLTPFAGDWINSNEGEQWLQRFRLFAADGLWHLQIHTEQYQPEPVAVTSYVDNMGYLAFKAKFELADRQLIIAANTQKALVVMTTFERFAAQASATNQVYREIFIHQA